MLRQSVENGSRARALRPALGSRGKSWFVTILAPTAFAAGPIASSRPELALKVGQAAGLIFRNGEHRHRVLIGKDTRLSGYMIENALVAGFTSVGMDVLLTGPIPTPAVGMLARSMRADLGVMISASHNPFDDNGIKLFGPDGFKLSRRGRAEDREADRFRPRPSSSPSRATSAAPGASTACRTAISSSPS